MELNRMLNLIIAIGRLCGHLKGAWRCTCEIACIVDTAVSENNPAEELLDGVIQDPGF